MWELDRAHQIFTFGRSLSCSHNSCRFSSPDTLQLSWLNLSDVWNVMSSLKMRLDKNNSSSDSIRWIYHWIDKRGIAVMERSGGLDIVMSVVETEQYIFDLVWHICTIVDWSELFFFREAKMNGFTDSQDVSLNQPLHTDQSLQGKMPKQPTLWKRLR